jgi:hypothetical protein
MSPPFVPKDKEKVGVSDSAYVLVIPVCSGYIGALTKSKPSVSDKVEASSSGPSAMAAVKAANANAQAAQVVSVAATVSTFKPATPPRYENKDKDMEICKWLLVVESCARICNDGDYLRDYLRIVSFFLHGKPRSYFQSKYDAYKAANRGAEPANPREFFRETMINGYGLSDQTQVYWDNWNNLRMLANMDIGDYNIAFT